VQNGGRASISGGSSIPPFPACRFLIPGEIKIKNFIAHHNHALLQGTLGVGVKRMIPDGREENRKQSPMNMVHKAGLALFMVMVFLQAAVAGVDCTTPAYPPTADFTYTIDPSVSTPLTVHFTSTSDSGNLKGSKGIDPIATYSWNFDDGSSSTSRNPVHAYVQSSNKVGGPVPYKVSLTVTSECRRTDTVTKSIYAYCTCPYKSFTIVQPAGKEPYTLPVTLVIQDTSTGLPASPTYVYDLFRAQSISSPVAPIVASKYEKNPTFVITDSGFYSLRQQVFNPCAFNCNVVYSGTGFNVTIPAVPFAPVTTTVTTTATTSSTTAATTATTAPVVSNPATTVTPTTTAAAAVAAATTASAQSSAAVSPGTGTLSVTTNPAGAQVFVDDVMRGLSPANIPGLSAGPHTLRLEKSSYRNMTVPVSIEAGKTTDYSTGLEAESGGMGIMPILAAIIVIAAGAGAAVWYLRKKTPASGEQK
jgi:hypothetical protein